MAYPVFYFGDIVVVDENQIGVIVKTWAPNGRFTYEVYVRSYNSIKDYGEDEIARYRVRHKYLDDREMEWQNNF